MFTNVVLAFFLGGALLTAAAPAGSSVSATKRADGITDVQILNYALTLEHLENAFYKGALAKYDAAAFRKAGFPDWVRGRFAQIGGHEAQHVSFLATALGDAATKPCEYTFPYTDPKSFVALSSVLEQGGVSAYLGAASLIQTPAYVTAAGSILTTEARHQGWVASSVQKGSGWSSAFDTPLDFDQIYSIVSPFIKSCPSSNPALPVKAFPAATYTPAAPASGSEVTLKFTPQGNGPFFLALYSGLTTTIVPVNNSKATLPGNLQGTVFGLVSNNRTAVSDDSTIAGPLIFSFPFGSNASN